MPAIPPTGDFPKATIDKDTFHAKFLAVHAYLTGLLGSDGVAATARAQLGLGTAATRTVGTGASEVPINSMLLLGVPSGAVCHFAMSAAPTGWLKADGSQVLRSTYTALDAAIGQTFGTYTNGSGAAGTTHLVLPDLRGEFIRGYHDGDSADPDYATRTFGSGQTGAIESHTHGLQTVNAGAESLNGINYRTPFVNVASDPTATSATGGTETRPRNVALLACIKY